MKRLTKELEAKIECIEEKLIFEHNYLKKEYDQVENKINPRNMTDKERVQFYRECKELRNKIKIVADGYAQFARDLNDLNVDLNDEIIRHYHNLCDMDEELKYFIKILSR